MGVMKIVLCNCLSDYMDKTLGLGKRWANPVGKSEKGTTQGTHRCVVCGKIHTMKDSSPSKVNLKQ